jgi:hypothetical protein
MGIESYSRCDKRGKVHYYATLVRTYSDLNLIGQACWDWACKDLREFKKVLRLIKIAKLEAEISNI